MIFAIVIEIFAKVFDNKYVTTRKPQAKKYHIKSTYKKQIAESRLFK